MRAHGRRVKADFRLSGQGLATGFQFQYSNMNPREDARRNIRAILTLKPRPGGKWYGYPYRPAADFWLITELDENNGQYSVTIKDSTDPRISSPKKLTVDISDRSLSDARDQMADWIVAHFDSFW